MLHKNENNGDVKKCPMCGSGKIRNIFEKNKFERDWELNQCQLCKQHFTHPTPTLSEISSFYANNYHNDLRTEEGAENIFNTKYLRYIDTIKKHLKSGRIIDVGCSTGLLVHLLNQNGFKAEGIELNKTSAEWGKQNYDVTIHSNPLEQCEYEHEALDAILFTDVLEHTQHPCNYLKMAGQYLTSKGIALVTFPDINSIESRYKYFCSKLFRRKWIWGNCYIPLHIWEFTPATAQACFNKAGFEVIDFQRSQQPMEPNDALIIKILDLPIKLLSWPKINNTFGSQMEFVIRKTT